MDFSGVCLLQASLKLRTCFCRSCPFIPKQTRSSKMLVKTKEGFIVATIKNHSRRASVWRTQGMETTWKITKERARRLKVYVVFILCFQININFYFCCISSSYSPFYRFQVRSLSSCIAAPCVPTPTAERLRSFSTSTRSIWSRSPVRFLQPKATSFWLTRFHSEALKSASSAVTRWRVQSPPTTKDPHFSVTGVRRLTSPDPPWPSTTGHTRGSSSSGATYAGRLPSIAWWDTCACTDGRRTTRAQNAGWPSSPLRS